jgi:hypothetical protein
MTAPRQQRKAQMAAAASSRTEPDARPRSTAIRSKPVRITLDLSPGLYRELTRWVALADVLRAMIRVTAESPDTSGEVTAQLRRDRER